MTNPPYRPKLFELGWSAMREHPSHYQMQVFALAFCAGLAWKLFTLGWGVMREQTTEGLKARKGMHRMRVPDVNPAQVE